MSNYWKWLHNNVIVPNAIELYVYILCSHAFSMPAQHSIDFLKPVSKVAEGGEKERGQTSPPKKNIINPLQAWDFLQTTKLQGKRKKKSTAF